jgi:hypothetical protein
MGGTAQQAKLISESSILHHLQKETKLRIFPNGSFNQLEQVLTHP